MPIPGSDDHKHQKDNIDLFDFALSEEEMKAIEKLDGTMRF